MAEDIILSQNLTTPVFCLVELDSIATCIHSLMQRIDNYPVKEQKRILVKNKTTKSKTRSSIYNLCLLNIDLILFDTTDA